MSWQKSSDAWRRREIVAHVQASHGVSERRSCLALGVDRSSVRYVSHKPDQAPLRLRIHDLAAARVRYGYFRIYILLRRERLAGEPQTGLPAVSGGWIEPSAQAASSERQRGEP